MTKIDIFSGFLGAGKTTLIKKLLDGGFKNDKLVLIENEFGEIGIDATFLQDAAINITEMNSGCICCSLVGDFGKALKKVLDDFSPDRILIEPSGVGKLSDVIKAITDLNDENLVLSSATTVVDAKKCKMYMKNFGEFFNNQIETAKCIILSHTDSLSDEKIEECVDRIKEKNPAATIVTTPWDKLTPAQIVAAIEGASSIDEEIEQLKHDCEHHHHEHSEHCSCGHEHHHHHAEDVFTSFGFETAKKYSHGEIYTILKKLENEEKYGLILRAKGYVASNQDEWIYFDYIPQAPDVRFGNPSVIGRICIIGTDICEEKIKELFKL